MPDLQHLLDQIDRLDQEATKGPWENIGRTIESNGTYEDVITTEVDCSSYCYGGKGGGVLKDKDAEFIVLARTALPTVAKVLQAVLNECDEMDAVNEPAGESIRQAITDAMEGDDEKI